MEAPLCCTYGKPLQPNSVYFINLLFDGILLGGMVSNKLTYSIRFGLNVPIE